MGLFGCQLHFESTTQNLDAVLNLDFRATGERLAHHLKLKI